MKITRMIATGVLWGWMCQNSMAAPPGIERPSPPPCCADGQCFASPLTYGYYDTRWRRWPLESLAQASQQKPAAATLPNEIGPFVRPPAEQEDRKAPPPSVPAGEQTPAGATGGAARTPGAPGSPTPPPGFQQPPGTGAPASQPRGTTGYPSTGLPTPPQTAPAAPPAAQPSTQPLYKSVSPDSPLNRSGTGPMGDADPPPALPFGPTLVAPEQPTRDVTQQPSVAPRRSPSVKPVDAPSNDPPPAPPIALASYEQ